MREFCKRRFALILALFLVVSLLPQNMQLRAEDAGNTVKIGDNAVATYDSSTKTITVTGTGEITYNASFKITEKFPETTKVVISNGITALGYSCFYDFANRSKIETVELASSVKEIGAYAFEDQKNLKSITVPADCKVGRCAFFGCASLADSSGFIIVNNILVDFCKDNSVNGGKPFNVTIPEGVTKIANSAFFSQSSVDGNTIYSAVNSVTLSTSVKEIEPNAFAWDKSITEIKVADGNANFKSQDGVLLSKDGKTLWAYPRNKKVQAGYTVPEGVETINEYAFNYVTLEKVILSKTVKSLGVNEYALHGIFDLKEIAVDSNNPNYESKDGVLYSKGGSKLIQYPIEKSGKSYVVGSGVTTIAYAAFYDNSELNSIEIGENVKTIGNSAFSLFQSKLSVNFKGNAPAITAHPIDTDEVDKIFGGWTAVEAFYPQNNTTWTDKIVGKKLGAKSITWTPNDNNITPAGADKKASGLLRGSDNNWYYFKNGVVDTTCNDVINNSQGWWVVRNGKVDFSFKGIASNKYGNWYCQGGKVNFGANGLVQSANNEFNGWYNVKGGNLQKGKEALVQNSQGWWYVGPDGKVDFSKNTVAQNSQGWWVIRNGKVDFAFKGIASNKYGNWYCQGGKVNFGANGLVQSANNEFNGWYYVKGGNLQKGKEALVQNSQGWWYVGTDGKVDFKKNTVAQNSQGWWVIRNGKVDFSYNGLASNNYGTWYIKNGKVDFNANGTYTADGKTYTIKNGKVV